MAMDEATLEQLAATAPERTAARGKCGTCGFFGKRWLDPTQVLVVEATETDRHNGDRLWYSNAHHRPVCFVGAASIANEIDRLQRRMAPDSRRPAVSPPGDTPVPEAAEAARRILWWDRQCLEWFPWKKGRTPNQHVEDQDMLLIENQRRDLQERLAALERDTQLAIARLQAEVAEKQSEATRDTNRTFLLIALIGVLLAALAVGATLYPDDTRRLFEAVMQWLGKN